MSQDSNRFGDTPMFRAASKSNAPQDITEAAREALTRFPPWVPITLIGHPRMTEDDYAKGDEQSAPTKSECSKCSSPIWSTLLKDEIMRIATQETEILCLACVLEKRNNGEL